MRSGAVFLAAAALLSAGDASANCARPVSYEARVEGNTVEIEPVNFSNRACPDASGMLRQDVRTGAVVRVADRCKEKKYVDECVPPGTYRYGFGAPYECSSAACSTDYFVDVEVTAALACAVPSLPPARAPWGRSRSVCSYGGRLAGCAGGVLLALVTIAVVTVVMIRRARKR